MATLVGIYPVLTWRERERESERRAEGSENSRLTVLSPTKRKILHMMSDREADTHTHTHTHTGCWETGARL